MWKVVWGAWCPQTFQLGGYAGPGLEGWAAAVAVASEEWARPYDHAVSRPLCSLFSGFCGLWFHSRFPGAHAAGSPSPSGFQRSLPGQCALPGPDVGSHSCECSCSLEMGLQGGGLRVLTRTCASAVAPGPLSAQAPSRGQLVLRALGGPQYEWPQ